MADRVDVVCPCCETRLVVDVETGEILSEERPKHRTNRSFEEALQDVRGSARRRENVFVKATERTRKLDDILAKKFAEARKKAEKDPTERPRNIFDDE